MDHLTWHFTEAMIVDVDDDPRSSRPSCRKPVKGARTMGTSKAALRGVWLAIIVLAGLVIGALAGVVFHALAAPLLAVIGAGGTVFIGVVTMGMNTWRFLTE